MMYYYNDGENEVGPFAISRLKTLRENGLLADGTLVRSSESNAWMSLLELLSTTKPDAIAGQTQSQFTPTNPEAVSISPSPEAPMKSSATEETRKSSSDEISETDPKAQPQSPPQPVRAIPPSQTEKNQQTQPTKPIAPKERMAATKLTQSYDPAYKYIPHNKVNSPAQRASASAIPTEASDPAYKYIPENKRISPKSEPQIIDENNGPPGWLSAPPTPWRRYAARILDTSLNGGLGFFLLGVVLYATAPATADNFFSIFDSEAAVFLDILLTGVLASMIGGALIGVSGFTMGKLIFGVKVVRKDGGNLGIGPAVLRDLEVLIKGMGLGIPIIAIFTMWFSYTSLTKDQTTTWDKGKYQVYHRPPGPAQYFLNVLGIVAIVLVIGTLSVIAEM